ncbi:MAG: MFS transporter [Pseudomonadota bacterium]
MKVRHFALLFVVFLDLMNQGLVIPILTTIMLDPSQGFLAAGTSMTARHFDFGLVMGVFFLFWFFGAAYISKLSDAIGRKEGILICLAGNLLGYVLAIVALALGSFWLLLVARAISGFTAGNQPIAQAALVDLSESEAQKTRFLGYVLTALSLGLVVGPLIGGLFSDPAVLGAAASLALPFYVVSCLVLVNIVLIALVFQNQIFQNQRTERKPVRIRPQDIVLTLWEAVRRPVIRRLSVVYFFGQAGLYAYFLFMDNYFLARFGFNTLQNSLALAVLGVAMGLSSTFLVGPLSGRYDKKALLLGSLGVMAVSAAVALANPWPLMAYVLILPLAAAFAIYLPTTLTLFSAAVDADEQGWIMGVAVALFTLGSGLVSLLGGRLMAIDIHFPFAIAAGCSVIAGLLILLLWRGRDIRALIRD